jgi:inosine/xanthosine triphosphatase
MPLVVVIGSTRPAKVEGTREALQAIARIDARFADFTLEAHDVTDIAPQMPMSLDEILAGARGRASAVLRRTAETAEASNPGTFAVGLEGGLHAIPTAPVHWSLQSWAAVTDGEKWSYGAGPSLVLPSEIADRVLAGGELGDVIDQRAGEHVRGTRGAWGVLTHDLIGRRDAFRMAVIAAFAPFYQRPSRPRYELRRGPGL